MYRFLAPLGLLALVTVSMLSTKHAGAEEAVKPEDEAKARALFKKAEVHFALGEFNRAIEGYKNAYRIAPLPGFLFNLGQCYRSLGKPEMALHFYKQYAERSPAAKEKTEVERLIHLTERDLEREREAARQKDQVERGAASARQPAQLGGDLPEDPPLPGFLSRPPLAERWRNAFVTTAALTGVLLASGTVTGIFALEKNRAYKDPSSTIDERRTLKREGDAFAIASTACLATAGAAAVSAILFYYLAPSESRATIAAAPTPSGAAVTVGGRF
jgi:tetratricopeptide (TPR) repeat protein